MNYGRSFLAIFSIQFSLSFKIHMNHAKQSQDLTENNFCIFLQVEIIFFFLDKPKANGTLKCENKHSVFCHSMHRGDTILCTDCHTKVD